MRQIAVGIPVLYMGIGREPEQETFDVKGRHQLSAPFCRIIKAGLRVKSGKSRQDIVKAAVAIGLLVECLFGEQEFAEKAAPATAEFVHIAVVIAELHFDNRIVRQLDSGVLFPNIGNRHLRLNQRRRCRRLPQRC